ncbi:MAG: zinc-finger domain-containing protein [Candidatus Thiodiazotropha endolucinida]
MPLSCPRPGEALAGLHPRVYLPIEKTGSAVCPYCGTRYQLSD